MIDIRFSVAGPGRVGRSLAHWLTARGGRLRQVVARRRSAAEDLASALGGRAVDLAAASTEGDDLLLVAVSDPALEEVAEALAERPQADVVLHVSGAYPADVLAPLRKAGSAVGSLHPLRAFPRVEPDVALARGTLFAIDGDRRAAALARSLVEAWEARWAEVEPSQRLLYHLAASLAAGGVVTVLSMAREILDRAELPAEIESGYFRLARQALDEAEKAEHPRRALTGPVARGDARLVERQLEDLAATAPELGETVVALFEATRRASLAGAETEETWRELGRILAKAKQRKSFLDP